MMSGPDVPLSPGSSPRPTLKSQQSTSLPSTPNQRARDQSPPPKSPPSKRNTSNPSPRPYQSTTFPSTRRGYARCKYETAMLHAKRRVAYSLGPDPLDPDPEPPKLFISPAEDSKLTADILDLYNELLPCAKSEERRKRLVEKLELILQSRWPGFEIVVNVFGSTGNKLGTGESDVDICITTDCKELESVCLLADVLAQHGMERVVCISAAKVPIVKIWDPELQLACDLNVNNPVALENTAMIRAYVDLDERVRPLAMVIKHWARRRVLNEAALGGTLSSYTWICMIIHFLQTRQPPILPALQQPSVLPRRFMGGLDVTYDRDIGLLRGYGSKNEDSVASLLFQFFRYYGHELNYEVSVISVRAGRLVSKVEKNWHYLQDNRLCVEEPFNTARNLGNTADDTSVRGIHLELRRAFKLVSEASLIKCCEEYEHPANTIDDMRQRERSHPSGPRGPLAYPQATSRQGRGGARVGRQFNQPQRLSQTGRRASSASTRGQGFSPNIQLGPSAMPMESALHAQQRQNLLHDHLYIQYQLLQAQEQDLRQQLQQQSNYVAGRAATSAPYSMPVQYSTMGIPEELMLARAGVFHQPPLTAPIRPQGFSIPTPYGSYMPRYSSTTNPPSPQMSNAVPDSRRTYRRSSVTNGSTGGSLRAHSQPPRSTASPMPYPPVETQRHDFLGLPYARARDLAISDELDGGYMMSDAHGRFRQRNGSERSSSEYIGYYLGNSPPLPLYSRSVASTPYTRTPILGIGTGNASPQILAQVPSHPLSAPLVNTRFQQPPPLDLGPHSARLTQDLPLPDRSSLSHRRMRSNSGPVVVNGSIERPKMSRAMVRELNGSSRSNHLDVSGSDAGPETSTSSEDLSQGMLEVKSATEVSSMTDSSHSKRNSRRKPRSSSTTSNGTKENAHSSDTVSSGPSMVNENIRPQSQATAAMSHEAGPVNGVKNDQELQGWLQHHLSPVKEVQTPPSVHKTIVGLDEAVQPAPKDKGKGKNRAKKSPVLPAEPVVDKTEATAAPPTLSTLLPNLNPLAGKAAAGSWQTQKKKSKHKANKSEADLRAFNINPSGGEFLPLDESLRKGG